MIKRDLDIQISNTVKTSANALAKIKADKLDVDLLRDGYLSECYPPKKGLSGFIRFRAALVRMNTKLKNGA